MTLRSSQCLTLFKIIFFFSSLYFIFLFICHDHTACEILLPSLGIKLTHHASESRVLFTGLPGSPSNVQYSREGTDHPGKILPSPAGKYSQVSMVPSGQCLTALQNLNLVKISLPLGDRSRFQFLLYHLLPYELGQVS